MSTVKQHIFSWLWRLQGLKVPLVSILILFLCGFITAPWQARIWRQTSDLRPEFRVDSLSESMGQGLVLGFVSGFRSIIADFLFIRSYTYWEQRELAKMQRTYELAVSIDPRSLSLWLNGARIIAYDAPSWRIQDLQEQGQEVVSAAQKQEISDEQAQMAIEFIRRAARFHPNDYRVPLEQAQIYMNRLEDYPMAAKYFLTASRMPNAPYYTGRLYAELLRQMGRHREAYEYLVRIYPELPHSAVAAKPVVLERIRQLELQLAVSDEQRFAE